MNVVVNNNNSTLDLVEVTKQVQSQPIYWSDGRNEHYFFDFKIGDAWIESQSINNELTECVINITKL